MKATGIVRKVDDLGRIVLPKELRNVLDINEKDPLEIYTEGDQIILKKYEPACIFCGGAEDVVLHHGKNVCTKCGQTIFYAATADRAETPRRT